MGLGLRSLRWLGASSLLFEFSFAVRAAKLAERGESVVASVLTVISGRLPLPPRRCTFDEESLVLVPVAVDAELEATGA